MYGTLTLADLLNTTTQSIAQGGPGYEREVWAAFQRSLAGYEIQLAEATSLWVERTTERLMGALGRPSDSTGFALASAELGSGTPGTVTPLDPPLFPKHA